MRRQRSFTAFLTALLAVLLLFSGCKPGGTEQETETNRISKENLSEYTIVYTARSDRTAEKELAVGLRDSLRSRFGTALPMATDRDTDGSGKVILVGSTALTQSVTVLAELTREDWAVRRMGDATVLAGKSTGALEAAIAYFLEHGVTADGAVTPVSHTESHRYEFAETTLSLASLNLRTAGSAKHNNQSLREPRIVGFVGETKPDSIGTQECTAFWRTRLDEAFGAIGYKRAQFTHPNPEAMKNYIWYCISCGWGLFEAREGGVRYVHMNTHLDYTCEDTRLDECAVLLPHAHVLAKRGYPVFLTGDFNAPPDSPTHERMLVDGLFRDFRAAVPAPALPWTFNHYLSEEQEPEPADFLIIDYGFYSDGILPQRLTVTDKADGGYLSDHNALCFDMTITNETEEPQT